VTVEIRACGPDEIGQAFMPIFHYFGAPAESGRVERLAALVSPERVHAAWEDGVPVGGAGSYSLEVAVPGARVPAAGVMGVGVLPTHRRQGVLTALMRAQLDEAHRRGEPLSVLWASEDTIYGRFGYGIASLSGQMDLDRTHAEFAEPAEPESRVRLVSDEEALALCADVYDRAHPELVGSVVRSEAWWRNRRFQTREGEPPLVKAVIELDGRPGAYALYQFRQSMTGGVSEGYVDVLEAIGDSPAATRGIWQFLLGIDWTASVRASILPVDHPLFLLLAHPRRMRFRIRDGLWTRLVDVGAALSARRYAAESEVVLEVRDDFCPWNEARYVLAAAEGEGKADRTTRPAEIALDVRELGSVYLGGFTFRRLGDAGRIEELAPGAIARADSLFRTDRAPWCPEIF